MYYEDMIYNVKLRENVRDFVGDFYVKEMKAHHSNEQTKEQIAAISTYNLMSFGYVNRFVPEGQLDRQFTDIIKDLDIIFRPANNQDLFMVRLENFMVRLNLLFGKSLIDEMQEDFIDYLCAINPARKYLEDPFVLRDKITKKQEEAYRRKIEDVCDIYPFLWIVPFFSELFVASKS